MQDDFSTAPIEPSQSKQVQKQAEARKIALAQEASKRSMKEFAQEAMFSTLPRRFETIEERIRKKELAKKEAEKTEEKLLHIEEIESLSEEFHKRNPELEARTLQLLRSQVRAQDSTEEILNKVMKNYPDHSLADEALEFLERATPKEIAEKVRTAKENLNETYGREVRAGRNMGAQARAFSQQGLGSPTGLRDLYRDITGNPREASTLFDELHEQFSYEKLQTAIDFILHSMGADLKSKGPSIAPGELHTLMTEARNLIAILWVYRFFKKRMGLISSLYERSGMLLPSRMTFELLAKMFVQFLRERYPSMDKIFQLALKMGISADTLAQIILFSQMRDAVRGVAPRLFRSNQHRHDVLMSFIEALEELEEQVEGEEEKKETEEEEEE